MEVFGGIIAGICSKSVRVIWRILVILESGDSSVRTRRTVHQEVRIKPMAEITFCVTRALSLQVYSGHSIKWVQAFGGWGPSHRAWTENKGLCPLLIGRGQ